MLILPASVAVELTEAVRDGYPHEVCGVLVGTDDGSAGDSGGGTGRRVQVVRAVPTRNLDTERTRDRYLLDPDDFRRADEQARADGLGIVGIWHSHPDHPAEPSETDRRSAWEGWSYLIAAVTSEGLAGMRSWRLVGQRFIEEEIAS